MITQEERIKIVLLDYIDLVKANDNLGKALTSLTDKLKKLLSDKTDVETRLTAILNFCQVPNEIRNHTGDIQYFLANTFVKNEVVADYCGVKDFDKKTMEQVIRELRIQSEGTDLRAVKNKLGLSEVASVVDVLSAISALQKQEAKVS